MRPQEPAIDLLFSRHGVARRLYVAPRSWVPPVLAKRMDAAGEVFPVHEPDLADLEAHMSGLWLEGF